ncbi:MliC family protein [Oceanidesulfovibrio indonesiensis]|uniref:MliC family protein n=1 Tax=Oceanidesulfovibrio indonesiensis TaxID=54767 RepID=UPI0014311CAE|nr:MliC family protein [Oceanidesulfovibrio indonesiensis]
MIRQVLTCILLCLAVLLAGCDESADTPSTARPLVEDSRIVDQPEHVVPDLPDEVPYICASDDDIETLTLLADFSSEPIILHIEDTTYELQTVPSGSGARYESESVVFWTKGKEATLGIRGGQYRCTVASD